VLRFADFGGEPQQTALADGLTEDIVTELSPVVGLAVVRGASAKPMEEAGDGAEVGIPQLGRELGVRFVLMGSVRKIGNVLRVTAQLVQVADGDHIWAERYDLRGEEALKAQDELTETITTQLVVRIRRKDLDLARRKPAALLDGYDDYLFAKDYLARDSFEGIAQARALFERAIAANARYAPAMGGLAVVQLRDFHLHRGALQGDAALDRVFETAQRSLSIEPGVSDAADAVASVYLFRRRHQEAADLLRKAIAATADDADLNERLGDVLIFAGAPAEGIATLERVMRLNPYYRQGIFAALARGYLLLDRRDDAVVQAETCMARAPDYRPCFEIAAIDYTETGAAEKAAAAIAQIRRLDPNFSLATASAVLPFKKSGDFDRFIDGLRKAGLEK
jgi:adenylate cyclase